MKPAILISGANGFVGSALCAQAIKDGYSVFTLTRRPFELTGILGNEVLKDFSKVDSIHSVLEKSQVVIHLAARVHVMNEFSDNALSTYRKVNVENTVALARAAAKAGVKRFIYLSSVKVNGEKTIPDKPFTADDIPAPQDPYGISKLEAELALLSLGRQVGMEIVIIRPPLVYGPGVGANFLSMMEWISRRIPLPLAAINNRRSMVALDNLLSLIDVCISHPRAAGEVFLVSDGQDVSVTQLLEKLAKAMKISTMLLPVPVAMIKFVASALGRSAVAQRLCDNLQLDISKTKIRLEWTPPLNVDEGLKRTADWYLAR